MVINIQIKEIYHDLCYHTIAHGDQAVQRHRPSTGSISSPSIGRAPTSLLFSPQLTERPPPRGEVTQGAAPAAAFYCAWGCFRVFCFAVGEDKTPEGQRSRLGAHSSARRRAWAISPRVILVVMASRIRARASRTGGGAAAVDRLSHLEASTMSCGTPKPRS